VSDEVDLIVLIGGAEEHAAIQWGRSMCLSDGGDGILRGGSGGGSGKHFRRERFAVIMWKGVAAVHEYEVQNSGGGPALSRTW
jgi:hypothetical protein